MPKACDVVDRYADMICSRGRSGGQVRDEYREEFDAGRGGVGRAWASEYDNDQ